MERAATTSMRCLRSSSRLSLNRAESTHARSHCATATGLSVRNARLFTSTTASSPSTRTRYPFPTSVLPSRTLRHSYSTEPSTPLGTIGSGSAGASSALPSKESPLQAPEHLNDKERQIWEMLMKELDCTRLEVQDISGGCGSMYGIDIVSERFRGLGMLKQQRLVNEVLGEEIKGWHGVQLKTSAP